MVNRSPIEWTDYSLNPISGCSRGCPYCYAKRMAYRLRGRFGYPAEHPFESTLHFDKLTVPERRKAATKIFLTSMGDLFDRHVPDVWRYLVFNMARYSTQHTFMILTKQVFTAASYSYDHEVPDNLWIGISQDGKTTQDEDIEYFRSVEEIPHKFVSFEPLLGPISANFYGIEWIIIGAQTGPRAKQPRWEWVQDIIAEADSWDIPVFLKNNLEIPDLVHRPQEFPEARNC